MEIPIILKLMLLFGILGLLLTVAYESGAVIILLKRIGCRVGRHKFHTGWGKKRINRYYCRNCKKPRKGPKLEILDGGNKMGQYKYKSGDKDGR